MNSILIITYVNLSASALLELKSEGLNLKFDQPSEVTFKDVSGKLPCST